MHVLRFPPHAAVDSCVGDYLVRKQALPGSNAMEVRAAWAWAACMTCREAGLYQGTIQGYRYHMYV